MVLDCLDPKEMRLQFLSQRGEDPLGDSSIGVLPSPGLEIGDEGAFGVPVGGSVSGVIDFDGDTDNITVFLVSGQTYLISLHGSGAHPLSDSLLRVFAPDGVTQVAVDDDGGAGTSSLLTYTATTTGQHMIRAASFINNPDVFQLDTGGYTVDVRVQGVDGVGVTNGTSVPLQLGYTFDFREFGTGNQSPLPGTLDGDTRPLFGHAHAGHFYTFEVAGGWDGGASGPGAIDTLIALYNSAGAIVAQNDNIGERHQLGDRLLRHGQRHLLSRRHAAIPARPAATSIDIQDIDSSGRRDPLDAINWVSADNIDTVDVGGVPTAYVYFGARRRELRRATDRRRPSTSMAGPPRRRRRSWRRCSSSPRSPASTMSRRPTSTRPSSACRRSRPTRRSVRRLFLSAGSGLTARRRASARSTSTAAAGTSRALRQDIPGDQVSLRQGGFAYAVILHEFGHAHGLAHPHDNGGGSDIMLGVSPSTGFFGVFNLNQGVYTVMSYNDALAAPSGRPVAASRSAGIDNGWSATLSAFDIAVAAAALRRPRPTTTGDTTYTLDDVNDDGNWYECIWDTGGTDAIVYTGDTATR